MANFWKGYATSNIVIALLLKEWTAALVAGAWLLIMLLVPKEGGKP